MDLPGVGGGTPCPKAVLFADRKQPPYHLNRVGPGSALGESESGVLGDLPSVGQPQYIPRLGTGPVSRAT